jgi:septum site-determining protein MinC
LPKESNGFFIPSPFLWNRWFTGMPVNLNAQDTSSPPQFELKAGTFTLPLLRLLGNDMDAVAEQLAEKVSEAEGFFHNAPIVIDLKEVAQADQRVEFPLLVGLMRGHGMIPIGVRGGSKSQNAAAETMELAILSEGAARRQEVRPAAAVKPTTSVPAGTKLVTRPVRSGQRVYASGGDLIILAQVSSGAEIMADGNIHVYSALRGRALAGVKGDQDARIFCQDLQAELVSVAGHYRISENIDASLKGRTVHIHLQDRTLHIDSI